MLLSSPVHKLLGNFWALSSNFYTFCQLVTFQATFEQLLWFWGTYEQLLILNQVYTTRFWLKLFPQLFNTEGNTHVNIVNIHLNIIAFMSLHAGAAINLGPSFKMEFGIGQLGTKDY